jgi:hypothetical protein
LLQRHHDNRGLYTPPAPAPATTSAAPLEENVAGMLAYFILGDLAYALLLWASAEMINVVLDIEENTRRAAG